MSKHVLMVAYHYPPTGFSSGVHRTHCFANDLVSLGWHPTVLTVTKNAYATVDPAADSRINSTINVVRCPTVDAARSLSFKGRYPLIAALPDRWSSWWLSGVIQGLRAIKRDRPKAIWSTYPIATAHLIALTLHRLTGIPWIADFRDPMLDEHYPTHEWLRHIHSWIERRALRHARHCVFTTPASRDRFAAQHQVNLRNPQQLQVIANGFDAHCFTQAITYENNDGPWVLLHSGLLNPIDRPPDGLFAALKALRDEDYAPATKLNIHLRASSHDAQIQRLAEQFGVANQLTLLPPLPYLQAIDEMRRSDALLLLQGDSCLHQVPAKMYEYIRSCRPILALCSTESETSRQLANVASAQTIAPHNIDGIKHALKAMLDKLTAGQTTSMPSIETDRYDRRHRAAELDELLSGL